ncbi:MAG: helix-turn-helix domain-containing protein [Halovenus sp.]
MYEDGGVHVRLIGAASAISRIVDTLPDEIDLEVHEVGEQQFAASSVAPPLSDRQREAVLAALELGYYDQPRGATHKDVAERLGCAPSTASEHLRKAEAKLVRSQFGGERR